MHLSSFLAAKNIAGHVLLCARGLDTEERAWATAQLFCPLFCPAFVLCHESGSHTTLFTYSLGVTS